LASKQSSAVSRLLRSWLEIPAQDPDWSLDDQRDLVEGWNVLTNEPGGVDYLEVAAGGLPAMWAVPKEWSADRVLLCIHGGGFITGSIYTHRKLFAHVAKAAGVRALIVSYRLLPEGVHPAPVEDVFAAYRWLLDQGIAADGVAFVGDSAGGVPALATQLRARDAALPLPAAALLLSPWVDMRGILTRARSTPTSRVCPRSTSRSAAMSCCSTTVAGSPTPHAGPASTSGSTSSLSSSTRSR
jgi:acetyl esterase/lipase